MNIAMFIVVFLLFWCFIPGAIVVLPSASSQKWVIFMVHSFLFTAVLALIYKPLCKYFDRMGFPSLSLEGYEDAPNMKKHK